MVILSMLIISFVAASPEASAADTSGCIEALTRHIEDKGCPAGQIPVRPSGLKAITCEDVPLYVSVDSVALDAWWKNRKPGDLVREIEAAWSVTGAWTVNDLLGNQVCKDEAGAWFQIRDAVPAASVPHKK